MSAAEVVNSEGYTYELDPAKHRLSDLQKEELRIFKEFIKICKDNGLTYYIWGGSFLGAVRHHGFIPWDDDIDVSMPRPDFEKFLEIAPGQLPDDMYVSTYKRKDHVTLVAQVFNKDKRFVLNNATRKVRTGAWIDILVIDGAPRPGIKRKIFGVKYMYYRMMSQYAHFGEIVNLNKKRPWYENIAVKFAQVTNIEKFLNPVKIGDKFHALLKTNKFDECEYLGTFMGTLKMGEIFPKEMLGKGALYDFEDLKVNGPEHADAYLFYVFGNYMAPPPENMKYKHNVTE